MIKIVKLCVKKFSDIFVQWKHVNTHSHAYIKQMQSECWSVSSTNTFLSYNKTY